jgi:hypothetical protein
MAEAQPEEAPQEVEAERQAPAADEETEKAPPPQAAAFVKPSLDVAKAEGAPHSRAAARSLALGARLPREADAKARAHTPTCSAEVSCGEEK